MALFSSKYQKLSFYVNDKRFSFSSGIFVTDDKEIIAVLEKLQHVDRVDEPILTISNKPKQFKQEIEAEEPKKKDAKKKPSAK